MYFRYKRHIVCTFSARCRFVTVENRGVGLERLHSASFLLIAHPLKWQFSNREWRCVNDFMWNGGKTSCPISRISANLYGKILPYGGEVKNVPCSSTQPTCPEEASRLMVVRSIQPRLVSSLWFTSRNWTMARLAASGKTTEQNTVCTRISKRKVTADCPQTRRRAAGTIICCATNRSCLWRWRESARRNT